MSEQNENLLNIAKAAASLHSEIEGGLASVLGKELADEIIDHGSINIKLLKQKGLLEQMREELERLSQEYALIGYFDESPEAMGLSFYYKQLSEVMTETIAYEEVCAQSDKDSVEDIKHRRKNISTALTFAMGGVLLGGAAIPNKAEAFGDSAIMLSTLQSIQTSSWAQAYNNFVDTIQNLQNLLNGLNGINNTIIGGIDGMLMGNTEESSKQMIAQVTAQEKSADATRDNKRADIAANTIIGSGTCMQDAAETLDKGLAETEERAPTAAVDSLLDSYMLANPKATSIKEGEEIAKDLATQNKVSLNGAAIANAPIAATNKAREDSEKAFQRIIAKAPEMIIRDLKQVLKSEQGYKYASAFTTYMMRRGIAEGSLARLRQGRIKHSDAYDFLHARLSSVENTQPDSDTDDAKQSNSRLRAMASAMLHELDDISTTPDGSKGISLLDSLAFQVKAKNNSTFYEYIRSTGPGIAPLLREVVDILGTQLKISHLTFLDGRESNALLSAMLLELQDNPERIKSLNALNK